LKDRGKQSRSPNGWRIIVVGVILSFALQACFHPAQLQQANEWHSAQRVANLIRVPLTYQSYDYSCGVEALQSILYYYGEDFLHDEMAKVLKPDPINGTNYKRMVEFARSLGFQVDVRTFMSLEDLKKLIDDRKPTIVLIQAWPDSPVQWSESWKEGHYAVAIGYDEERIYFMDPSTLGHYTFIPIPEFLDRWHDTDGQIRLIHFGMVITREGSVIYNPDIIKRLD
jgi:predicted double-glycine peptidase